MDKIIIKGGKPLTGRIPISGAKNAALTLMPCALLTEEKLTLTNLPRLADVDTFSHLLNQLGVSTSVAGVKKGQVGRRMTLQAEEVVSTVAPYDMVRKMRVGQINAAMLTASGLAEIEPSVTALQLMPLAFRNWEEVDFVREKLRPKFEQRFREKGFVALFWGDAGWVRFFSRHAGIMPDDLEQKAVGKEIPVKKFSHGQG